jgi:exopolysaccharide biosynthesis polyprenyl glycosylphosphotransferase
VGARADDGVIPARRSRALDLVTAARTADPTRRTAVGRAVLVWVPCFALVGPRFASPAVAVGAASLLSAVWLGSLRTAFGAVHLTLGEPVRCAVGTALGLVGVSAVALWIPGMGMQLSTILALGACVFTLATAWEVLARRVCGKRRVLVVGSTACADTIAAGIELEGHAMFSVLGAVNDDPDDTARLGSVAELSHVIDEERPDLVVLTDGEASTTALDRLLAAPSPGVKVVGLAQFFDHACGRIPLDDLRPTWFMSILHVWRRPYTRFAKRTFDVVCAAVVLTLAAPLMAVVAGLIRLTSGPVVYRQTRVGEGGLQFTMHKFRTMRVDAESERPAFAQEGDPRVTRLGRWLRRTHADELPQLWDVLKGDMSVVGPRPERPEFIPMLEAAVPFFTRRLLVKPGITGWAQLRRDYASDCEGAAEKLSYDLWYLRHRTLTVDLAICAKTVSTVFLRPGR